MIGFNNGQKRNIQTKRYYWVRAGRIQHKIKEFLKFIKNDENQPPHNIVSITSNIVLREMNTKKNRLHTPYKL